MDLAKAMGVLGFTSNRWLDLSSGLTPKQELDKAHFSKMMNIMKKKKIVIMLYGRIGHIVLTLFYLFQEEDKEKKASKKHSTDSEKANGNKSDDLKTATKEEPKVKYNFKRKVLTPDDEIRILHEAYQFLLKKYKLGEDPKAAAALVSPFMKLEMEEKPVIKEKKKSKSSVSAEQEEEEEEKQENSDYQKELDKDFDDNVFALEKAADDAIPGGVTPKKGSIKRKKSSNASLKGEKTPVRKKSFRRDKSQSMKN